MTVISATSWPDAALAISGVLLVGAVAVVLIWQGLAIVRVRMLASREETSRKRSEA